VKEIASRRKVYLEYYNELKNQNYIINNIGSLYYNVNGYTLPLHILAYEATYFSRPWSEVDQFLSKFPRNMTKDAILWVDGKHRENPLHILAKKAPPLIFKRMLSIAPEAARIQDTRGYLPIHTAIGFYSNLPVSELLVAVYPQGVLMKDVGGETPISEAISFIERKKSILRGLIIGINKSYSERILNETLYEKAISVLAELAIDEVTFRSYLHVIQSYKFETSIPETILRMYYSAANLPLSVISFNLTKELLEHIFGVSVATIIFLSYIDCELHDCKTTRFIEKAKD